MACYRPISLKTPGHIFEATGERFHTVPCGKCIGCIRSKQNDWFLRARYEILSLRPFADEYSVTYKDNPDDNPCNAWFVTLTYDNDHLVRTNNMNPNQVHGLEYESYGTLCYKHIDDSFHTFQKWYRRRRSYGFSYFGCGEYGERYHR